jgi:hypothetical protein
MLSHGTRRVEGLWRVARRCEPLHPHGRRETRERRQDQVAIGDRVRRGATRPRRDERRAVAGEDSDALDVRSAD